MHKSERMKDLRSKWFGLLGVILALWFLAGPLTDSALAAVDNGDAHAGHDMSTMQSDQNSNHDMNNMDGMNVDGMPQDNPGGHDSDSSGSHYSAGSGHNSDGGGHGEEAQDPNTPPNWPVIYSFGAFNLMVIISAALLKTNGVNGVN